jgi:hypothetical protein
MIEIVLSFFSVYLIEFMGGMLILGLIFRYATYKQSKNDNAYYTSFTRELELNVERDREDKVNVGDIDRYLADILGRVGKKLPNRSLRNANTNDSEINEEAESKGKKVLALRDYVSGKQGLITNIQAENSVFHNQTPPNFTELTHRIMTQDPNWVKVMKHFPVNGITRMIDILPGLFIVLGVFGTFIGIAMALPEIANIDFNDLDKSADTLMAFVLSVTYAMKTSIAGIFFSLILTVLNTMFPIKETRFRVFKKVEISLQMLWYHVQHDAGKEGDQSLVMSKLLSVLERIEAKLSTQELNSNDNDSDDEKAS